MLIQGACSFEEQRAIPSHAIHVERQNDSGRDFALTTTQNLHRPTTQGMHASRFLKACMDMFLFPATKRLSRAVRELHQSATQDFLTNHQHWFLSPAITSKQAAPTTMALM
jgi:hypothetical protein